KVLEKRSFSVKKGSQTDISDLVKKLNACGYAGFDSVDGTCQYSVRGGIVDIFPSSAQNPVRIEFWDDFVENI
ncbi:hypothetical protein RFZ45_03360, partial [Acinetobacter baumannii]|nr:hypothetical protein [Acinetobacter baumannii]